MCPGWNNAQLDMYRGAAPLRRIRTKQQSFWVISAFVTVFSQYIRTKKFLRGAVLQPDAPAAQRFGCDANCGASERHARHTIQNVDYIIHDAAALCWSSFAVPTKAKKSTWQLHGEREMQMEMQMLFLVGTRLWGLHVFVQLPHVGCQVLLTF